MFGSFLDIFFIWEQDSLSSLVRVIIGLGAALAWIYILSYLEFNKKYTVLIDALILGMPNVLRFTVGAIPVYVGFALFGFSAFSESTFKFGSFGESVVTLFGIQNGDDIQNTFRALDSQVVVSRIYFFIFSIISIYTIANIFIAIMSNAYNYSAKKIHMGDDMIAREEQHTKIWADIMGMDTDSDDSSSTTDNGTRIRHKSKTKMHTPNDHPQSSLRNVNSVPGDIVVKDDDDSTKDGIFGATQQPGSTRDPARGSRTKTSDENLKNNTKEDATPEDGNDDDDDNDDQDEVTPREGDVPHDSSDIIPRAFSINDGDDDGDEEDADDESVETKPFIEPSEK